MDEVDKKFSTIPSVTLPPKPPGLEALYIACRNIYPDQPNPLQVSAVVKYWLGGPDPLDYISMYSNPGNEELGVLPHWHYISYGFSDLHGDGRVHEKSTPDELSGFGFELTFRLKREPGELSPPTWPAQLLQSLAKYVFHSDNVLKAGDHVSWHKALDNSESMIEHMLLLEDPQLGTVNTPNGTVTLIQIIGVTKSELEAAQKWSPQGVLGILKDIPGGRGGGSWLVTDMKRGLSIFELEPNSNELVNMGIEKEGSNLSGVTSYCVWKDTKVLTLDKNDTEIELPQNTEFTNPSFTFSHGGDSTFSEEMQPTELLQSRMLESVSLVFNFESGSLLPLAIRGRVKHGRHFTFKSAAGGCIITFVSDGVSGTTADNEHPYVAIGPWLQVFLSPSLVDELLSEINPDDPDFIDKLPKTYSWPERGLFITIEPDALTESVRNSILH